MGQGNEYRWRKFDPPGGPMALPAVATPVEDMAQLREAARAEGYQAGLDEGRAAAQQASSAALASLEQSLQAAQQARDEVLKEARAQMHTLLCDLFRALLCVELRANPAALEALVEHMIAADDLGGPVRILVSQPDMSAMTEAVRTHLGERLGVDAALAPGAVRVVSGRLVYETDVSAKLQDLLDELAAAPPASAAESDPDHVTH